MRFVIQKHAASRLHYDFRLETRDGVLKSWAVPKGVSLDPAVKRLAVETEDHPGNYISFEGEIPAGNYGAGKVLVWDTGPYETLQDVRQQYKQGKLKFTLKGSKVKGSFSLVKMRKDEKQWLLTKHRDQYASEQHLNETMPGSVLSDMSVDGNDRPQEGHGKSAIRGAPSEFPHSVKPMLALAADEPFDRKDWVFEVKWDGVRAIAFRNKSDALFKVHSRKGNDITRRYPEISSAFDAAVECNDSAVVDGEIVVLDKEGRPDFQRHQKRMNVDSEREIRTLSRSAPATYYVFDLLYLDGLNLEQLDFVERRRILSGIIKKQSSRIRISEYIEETGRAVFENAIAMKLEGIVAKYKFSKYLQGSRSEGWLKIKGISTQDCVVIGYTRGEGSREGYFGSLILAASAGKKLRFVGHTGSGFGSDQLKEASDIMQPLRVKDCPIDHVPYVNREPAWLRPELVVEVKFNGWTQDLIMRAPIFVRFREDKKPEECVIEQARDTDRVLGGAGGSTRPRKSQSQFSNLTKIFWPASSNHKALTKGDLIKYYDSIGIHILPHLRDRPLSLSRYPDGILGKSFYHKNWEQERPDYAKTIRVFSESRGETINYLMCNNNETLLWLANLGCIEMHPWYSRVRDFTACKKIAKESKVAETALEDERCGLGTPDFIIFDLDPYIYSGKEKGPEPEYNIRGFRAAVEVALELKDLLRSLKIKSYVKTSGKTGLHIFVPIAPVHSYKQTRGFAEIVGKIMARKKPDKITMEWNTSKRKGKVFFDYNQNAKGKTVASIYSARPTRSATVSMPVNWDELATIKPTDYTMKSGPEFLKNRRDPWENIHAEKQDIGNLLAQVTELE